MLFPDHYLRYQTNFTPDPRLHELKLPKKERELCTP